MHPLPLPVCLHHPRSFFPAFLLADAVSNADSYLEWHAHAVALINALINALTNANGDRLRYANANGYPQLHRYRHADGDGHPHWHAYADGDWGRHANR